MKRNEFELRLRWLTPPAADFVRHWYERGIVQYTAEGYPQVEAEARAYGWAERLLADVEEGVWEIELIEAPPTVEDLPQQNPWGSQRHPRGGPIPGQAALL